MSTDLQLVCPKCLAKNRLPAERLSSRPTCGRCQTPLLGEHPLELEQESFQRYTAENDLPVLVDFWAPWCGPCRTMEPQFEEAAHELAGSALLAKVDTEAQPELTARFGVHSIPTLILFRRGTELARHSGALSAAQIRDWVSAVAA